MSKEKILLDFADIVDNLRKHSSLSIVNKIWKPQLAYNLTTMLNPTQLKSTTLQYIYTNKSLDKLSALLNKNPQILVKEIKATLDEIGLSRNMFVVRSLAYFITKVLCQVCSSVFVNECKLFEIKSGMGVNPVIFVPTHRSYADFILIQFIFFYYDIELPAVAAGMDFLSMAGLGQFMRDCGAFYIRRTFATDKLYSEIFRNYVKTLVTQNHAPISFFIEGTRSRSNKSLAPKYGFLSMIMESYFKKEVGDITFVPVNLSYERLMEERLFAYELLGVPKPKESTFGFFKALNILSENYGNVYFNVGSPLSAKDYIENFHNKKIDVMKPVRDISLTTEEHKIICDLANEIIYKQQSIAIVPSIQLLAIVMTLSLNTLKIYSIDVLCEKIIWLSEILKEFGANVFDYNKECIENDIKQVLFSHKNLLYIDKNSNLKLINSSPFILTDEIKMKMKGHELNEKTMSAIIPVIMIQLYVNPIYIYFQTSCLISLIVSKSSIEKQNLWHQYKCLKILLRNEFPFNDRTIEDEFEHSLKLLIKFDVIKKILLDSKETYTFGENKSLQYLLCIIIRPFIHCLYAVSTVFLKEEIIEEKKLIKTIQKVLENELLHNGNMHPYSLSLDSISNSVQGFVSNNSLMKERREKNILYHKNNEIMIKTSKWIEYLLSMINSSYQLNNEIVINKIGAVARL